MISAKDAIACGRALLGTPYSELDCINFIKRIIRTAPGGVPGYTVAGTNALWKSAEASGKYRDLIWTQEGIYDAWAGMLAFKRDGSDVHHVGLVTGDGTVLHSSSAKGCVVETALDNGQWSLLAMHRYIQMAQEAEETFEDQSKAEGGDGAVLFRAEVVTKSDPLNVREKPHITGRKLGELRCGALVDVLSEGDGSWWRVRLDGLVGYASSGYLRRVEDTILPGSANGELSACWDDAAGDVCAVPRAQLLALADAAEAVNEGWNTDTSFAALTGKIGTLITAARAVTKALEGDD